MIIIKNYKIKIMILIIKLLIINNLFKKKLNYRIRKMYKMLKIKLMMKRKTYLMSFKIKIFMKKYHK